VAFWIYVLESHTNQRINKEQINPSTISLSAVTETISLSAVAETT